MTGYNRNREFCRIADSWQKATRHLSSPSDKYEHRDYQKIIEMGEEIIPVLLLNTRSFRSTDWICALETITKENPVPVEHAGNTEMLRHYWLKWGEEKGYL